MPLGDAAVNALAQTLGSSSAIEIDNFLRALETAIQTNSSPASSTPPTGLMFCQAYVDMYGPCSAASPSGSLLTDSTGGVANKTFAAITAPAANATTSLTADMTAVKNALAQLVTTVNGLLTDMCAIKNLCAQIMADLAAQFGLGLTTLDQ